MSEEQNEGGFFENILMLLGGISGAIFGYNNGEFIGLIIGALVLGAIGQFVGQLADAIFKLIFIVVIILLNNTIRIAIWSFIRSALETIFS